MSFSASLQDLPVDVFHPISSFLPNRDLVRTRLLSREHSRIAERYLRPTEQDLIEASRRGNVEAVRYLLSLGVEPSAENSKALQMAVGRGHGEVARMLLEDPRVDPSAENSKILWWAAQTGHVEIVRLLLEDGRADPTAEDSNALQLAVAHDHREIVRLLLEDGRVNPNADNGYLLLFATMRGSTEVARLLRQYSRVGCSRYCNIAPSC